MIRHTACLFVFLAHVWLHPAAVSGGDTHSLTYIYTAFSKPVNLPGIHEFTAMGLLNDRMIDYYDSDLKKKVPKQPWMKQKLEQDYWDKGTDSRKSKEQWFRVNLGILKDRMRHNDTGLHILQWRHGCTAETQDDKSLKFIRGRDEYSYDGNDFLAFDDINKRWIAPVDLAVPTKTKWDGVKMLNDYTQGYLERECVNWLTKFVDYGQEQLKESKPPELHVYSKKNRNPAFLTLHCLATGFLPKEVTLNIRRDGKVVDRMDGLETTGVRPNGDGTYQIMHRVEILRCDSARFTCEVIHPGSGMHKIKEWDHSVPRDCFGPGNGVIAGAVVAVLGFLMAGVSVAVIIYKKGFCHPPPPPPPEEIVRLNEPHEVAVDVRLGVLPGEHNMEVVDKGKEQKEGKSETSSNSSDSGRGSDENWKGADSNSQGSGSSSERSSPKDPRVIV